MSVRIPVTKLFERYATVDDYGARITNARLYLTGFRRAVEEVRRLLTTPSSASKRYPTEGARLSRKDHRLVARYFHNDIHVDVTPRFGNSEVNWVIDKLFNREHLRELKEMGYDLESLRFTLDKTPEAIDAHERRAGRR